MDTLDAESAAEGSQNEHGFCCGVLMIPPPANKKGKIMTGIIFSLLVLCSVVALSSQAQGCSGGCTCSGLPSGTYCPTPMPSTSESCGTATLSYGSLDGDCAFGQTTPTLTYTWEPCNDCGSGAWKVKLLSFRATPTKVIDMNGRSDLAGETSCQAAQEAKNWYDDAVGNAQDYDPATNNRKCDEPNDFAPLACIQTHEEVHEQHVCDTVFASVSSLYTSIASLTASGCNETQATAALQAAIDSAIATWKANDFAQAKAARLDSDEQAAAAAERDCLEDLLDSICQSNPTCEACP